MKKWIPLILVIFLIGCGQDLRSDEMRRRQEQPWIDFFSTWTGGMGGGSFRPVGIGSVNIPACNMSPGNMSACNVSP